MATRISIVDTCLAILKDTVYAFCIFYYYIKFKGLNFISMYKNVHAYVWNKLIIIIIINIITTTLK